MARRVRIAIPAAVRKITQRPRRPALVRTNGTPESRCPGYSYPQAWSMPHPNERFEYPAYGSTCASLWVLANPIDCDAMELWYRKHLRQDSESTADLDVGLGRC